jgi:predicted alpha/beta hydrolase
LFAAVYAAAMREDHQPTLDEWRERAERAESFRRFVIVAAVVLFYAWAFRDQLIGLLQKLPAGVYGD